MTNLEIAQARYTKADKILRIAVEAFVIFASIVFIVVSVQLFNVQNTIAENQKINSASSALRFQKYTQDNAFLHDKTQKYVKCIAQTLLRPIAERTNEQFDKCSAPEV